MSPPVDPNPMSTALAHQDRADALPTSSASYLVIPHPAEGGSPSADEARVAASSTISTAPSSPFAVQENSTSGAHSYGHCAFQAYIPQFEREYPPDPLGGELDEGARVWQVYRVVARAHDVAMLNDLNKTLDILLLLAGIFSAIVTTFLVDSYKSLEPDFIEYMAGAFYAMSLRNNSANSPLSITSSPLAAPSEFTPPTSARLLNGVWFASLILSLASAFVSILVKQWLKDYDSRTTASAPSPRHWAHQRTLYFEAFTWWHVQDVVAALPLCLHLAMFLFLSGLVLLLWNLDRSNSLCLLTLTALVVLFYIASTVVPFSSRGSPLATPLSYAIRQFALSVYRAVAAIYTFLRSGMKSGPRLLRFVARMWRLTRRGDLLVRPVDLEAQHAQHGSSQHATSASGRCIIPLLIDKVSSSVRRISRSIHGSPALWDALQQRRQVAPGIDAQLCPPALSRDDDDFLDARALQFLIVTSASAECLSVAYQAIAAFPLCSPALKILREKDCLVLIRRALKARYDGYRTVNRKWNVPRYRASPDNAGRDLRSAICLWGTRGMSLLLKDCAPALFKSVEPSTDYDVSLIIDAADFHLDKDAAARFTSDVEAHNFHPSTVPLVLQFHIPLRHRLQLLSVLLDREPPDTILLQATQRVLLEREPPDEISLQAKQSCRTPCPWESKHVLPHCTLHCSIELLSFDVISEDTTPATRALARTVISQLITRIDSADVMPLRDSAYLQFVATYVDDGWKHDDLERALYFMATLVETLKLRPDWREPLPKGWCHVWANAVAVALEAATYLGGEQGQDIASRVVTTVISIFNLEAQNLEARGSDQPEDNPDFATQLLSQTSSRKRSSWELLNGLLGESIGELFRVADHIVSSLYVGKKNSVLAHTFFATSPEFFRNLLHTRDDISDSRTKNDKTPYQDFINRCNEVMPWWRNVILPIIGRIDQEELEGETSLYGE